MQTTYPIALPRVLAYEGGYVNHPKDPGGATNKGVTQATYNGWRRRKGLPIQSVKAITSEEVAAIYKRDYWDAIRGDDLPAGPDFATFDAGVNSGPKRGAKWLQRALGVARDGAVGPVTIRSANNHRDKASLVKAICRYRLSFMQSLRIWSTFGKGWARRVASVEAFGAKLALAAAGATPGEIRNEAVGEASKARTVAKRHTGGATASGGATAADASQVDPGQGAELVNLILLAGLAIGVLLVAFFIVRAHIQRERAKAYERVFNGSPT